MIKAIIFDYFGVVSSDEYWSFIKINSNQDEHEFHDLADDVNRGTISWNNFCAEVAKHSGKTLEEANAMHQADKLNRILLGDILNLKNKYKIGLLTNAARSYLGPIIQETHLDSVFDQIVVSSDLGYIKPDKRIYLHIAELLSVKPEECVFVDDMVRNTEGAEQAGMESILYENNEMLHKQFYKLGIQI